MNQATENPLLSSFIQRLKRDVEYPPRFNQLRVEELIDRYTIKPDPLFPEDSEILHGAFSLKDDVQNSLLIK